MLLTRSPFSNFTETVMSRQPYMCWPVLNNILLLWESTSKSLPRVKDDIEIPDEPGNGVRC